MRIAIATCFLIFSIVMISAHLSIHNGMMPAFTFLGKGVPKLPEIPYAYGKEAFPSYFSDGSESHYQSISSVALYNINDDVATLGRVLFYDEALSVNENISCATCHQQAFSFADNVKFSMGVDEASQFNTPHLNDLGWSNNALFAWDMRFNNLQDLIHVPLKHPNELGAFDIPALIDRMEAQDYYSELFEKAYGTPQISENRITHALSQFIQAMTTFDTRYDQILQNQVNDESGQEIIGEQLFMQHCNTCHVSGKPSGLVGTTPDMILSFTPGFFTNFMPTEAHDPGAGSWNENFSGLFKVLSLRNIEKTAPYMHDGRFATLEDVVEYYSTGIPPDVAGLTINQHYPSSTLVVNPGGFDFSEYEKSSLVAFLKTLTDESFLTDERFSDPFVQEEQELEDQPYHGETKVFPNPTSGPLHISFANWAQRNIEVHIMDLQGRMIRQLSSHKNGVSTDISALPAGNYIIRVLESKFKVKDFNVVKID